MNIINWILAKRPGKVDEYGDRYEISHDSGEFSTIFKNINSESGKWLKTLGDTYLKYDGMDLFSSTFKLSSMQSAKTVESVELVDSLRDLSKYVSTVGAKFPEDVIPFMYQAGIGIYALGKNSGRIYEWDIEELTVTGEYSTLEDIFEEWLDAVA